MTDFDSFIKEGKVIPGEIFDRLRKLRNGINYYGRQVSVNVAIDAQKQIKEICIILKKRYLSQIIR